MAVSAAAALLDELMGKNRNDGSNAQKKPAHWKDAEFCEYFMVKFCPRDLFVNTRVNLKPCPKIHCKDAKVQYNEEASSDTKIKFENMFVKFVSSLLLDVNRHIKKGKRRLQLETEKLMSNYQNQNNRKKIKLLLEKINELVQKAEGMKIQGHFEEAQTLVKLCNQLKEKYDTLRKQSESIYWSQTYKLIAAKKKQMTVCEVCGAFLFTDKSKPNFVEHLMGRQHVGYDLLKKTLNEMQVEREKRHVEKLKKHYEEEEKNLIKSYSKSRNANIDKRSSRDRSCHRINRISERHNRERRRSRSRRGRSRRSRSRRSRSYRNRSRRSRSRRSRSCRSRSRSDCYSSNSPRYKGHTGNSCKNH